jgi:hypothetical protein
MARLVFSRDDETMYLLDSNGNEVGSWDAANNASNSTGRPCEEGSNGPAPNGNWDIDWGVQTRSGDAYGGDDEEFIPVGDYGSDGCHPSDEAAERGIGIHGGRTGYEHETDGCIRMNDDDIDDLEGHFGTQAANGDAIDSISIMDESFDADTFDADDVDNECEEEETPEEEGEGTSYDQDGGGAPAGGGTPGGGGPSSGGGGPPGGGDAGGGGSPGGGGGGTAPAGGGGIPTDNGGPDDYPFSGGGDGDVHADAIPGTNNGGNQ